MKDNIIVMAFPGLGKTSFVKKYKDFYKKFDVNLIDLDSAAVKEDMKANGYDPSNKELFTKMYLDNILMRYYDGFGDMADNEHNIVFISSHVDTQIDLYRNGVTYYLLVPCDPDYDTEVTAYINRLLDRSLRTRDPADIRAYEAMKVHHTTQQHIREALIGTAMSAQSTSYMFTELGPYIFNMTDNAPDCYADQMNKVILSILQDERDRN